MQTEEEKLDTDDLSAFCAGRTNGLERLARRYEQTLLGLASGLLGGRRELAADAVQEMWLRVIRFGGRFRAQSSVKTWLYRILLSRCRDLQAARVLPPKPVPHDDPVARAESTPAMAAERRDGESRLHEALRQLGDDKRCVLLLCYHDGLTHEQASEVLEVPLGTLKSRLHAALTELRAVLKEDDHA